MEGRGWVRGELAVRDGELGEGRREAPASGRRETGGTRGGGVETRPCDIMSYGTPMPSNATCLSKPTHRLQHTPQKRQGRGVTLQGKRRNYRRDTGRGGLARFAVKVTCHTDAYAKFD